MRQFDKMIFLGNLQCKTETEKVHKLLDRAFSCMSGLQQPLPCTVKRMPYHDAQDKKLREEVREIMRDIVMAVTGKEILFEDQ